MQQIPELTINWHVLEACNYNCYFCYAKYSQKSRFPRDFAAVLKELSLLKGKRLKFQSGSAWVKSIRVNFAGGEPFLAKDLGSAITLASNLGLRPSFISNGSLITDDFIKEYGSMISVAGFSIDSFAAGMNEEIGRKDNKGGQVSLDRFNQIFSLFREVSPETLIKINTVVCRENADADLSGPLGELRPDRWKALRVIPIHGAEGREITDAQFRGFLNRHRRIAGQVVHEDNNHMHRSYLMLDPEGRFYQREGSSYIKSEAVAKVGAAKALQSVEFDAQTFLTRY